MRHALLEWGLWADLVAQRLAPVAGTVRSFTYEAENEFPAKTKVKFTAGGKKLLVEYDHDGGLVTMKPSQSLDVSWLEFNVVFRHGYGRALGECARVKEGVYGA